MFIIKIIVDNIFVVGNELFGKINGFQHPHGKRCLPFLVNVQKNARAFDVFAVR